MYVVFKGEFLILGCDVNSFGSIEELVLDMKWIVVYYWGWFERVFYFLCFFSFVGMLKCVIKKINEFYKVGYCFLLCFLCEGWRRMGYLLLVGMKNFFRVILNKCWGMLLYIVIICVYIRWIYNCYFFIILCIFFLFCIFYMEGNFVSIVVYFDCWI